MSFVCKAIVASVIILIGAHSVSVAQFSTSKYEIGINAGTMVYQGDLARSWKGDYKSLKPAIGLYVSRTLDPYFAVRANLYVGKVAANDADYSTPEWKQLRAFKFNTLITELSSSIVFNFFGDNNADNFRRLSPYIFAGAGVSFLSVKRDWSNLNRTAYDSKSDVQLGLAIDSANSTPKVIPVLPVGAGLRFIISSQLALNAEATYRFTTTDYLDGFKYAANPAKRDSYYGLSLGISYRLGGYKCPKAIR
jgi:hypothetical protein